MYTKSEGKEESSCSLSELRIGRVVEISIKKHEVTKRGAGLGSPGGSKITALQQGDVL